MTHLPLRISWTTFVLVQHSIGVTTNAHSIGVTANAGKIVMDAHGDIGVI